MKWEKKLLHGIIYIQNLRKWWGDMWGDGYVNKLGSGNPFTMCSALLRLVTQSWRTLCNPMDYSPPGSSVHGNPPGKNTGMDCYTLLQGIFPVQRWNSGLLHCRRILHYLSHQPSPWIPEWVTYPFPRGSSQLKNPTGISCIAGGFFTTWATRKALHNVYVYQIIASCIFLNSNLSFLLYLFIYFGHIAWHVGS